MCAKLYLKIKVFAKVNNPKILIIGYSGSGKTTAAEILAEILNTKCLNTSDQLIKELAEILNISVNEILENKSQYRMKLFDYGRSKQAIYPLWPQVVQVQEADILTGLRSPDEVAAARENELYDIIIWIDRPGCKANKTDKLTPDHADTIVKNDGRIEDLRGKLVLLSQQLKSQQ